MKKDKIRQLAMYEGSTLAGSDVVKVDRNQGTRYASLTERHVWSSSEDARVYAGIRRVTTRLALQLALASGRDVTVYSAHGDLLYSVSPDKVVES